MESTVSPIFGKDAKKLQALRQKDPEKNLVERWKRLITARPDFEASYGFVPMVLETGWAVVAVPEDDVAYTVGLQYRFGQKDLLISAPHLSLEAQKRLLNELGRNVLLGARIEAGDVVTMEGGPTLTFKKYEDVTFSKYPCGYLARFEQFFEDRAHVAGGTLPVLWAELKASRKKRAPGSAKKKRAATKVSKKVVRRRGS